MEPLIGLLQGGLYALLLGIAIIVILNVLSIGTDETLTDEGGIVAEVMEYDVCECCGGSPCDTDDSYYGTSAYRFEPDEFDEFDDGWDLSGPPEGFTDFDVENGINALERYANPRP